MERLLPRVPCTPSFSVPPAFDMVAIGVVATAIQPIDPSQGALAVDAYLRIASMTILAYEYVLSTAFLLTLLVT